MIDEPEFITTNGKERTSEDCCIVSCGIGPHYQEPLHSTRLHCEVNAPEAWRLTYRQLPAGCPSHKEQMYAFKLWTIQRAIDAGFRYCLWMDTAFQPLRSIAPLWQATKRDGWYIPPQGNAMVGQYSNDELLAKFMLSRDQAMSIPLVFSGLVGLDLANKNGIGWKIWTDWKETQRLGLWEGPHYNIPGAERSPFGQKTAGHVSYDTRVLGHRHDEAALSLVLNSYGLKPEHRGFLTLETDSGFIGHHIKLMVPGGK